jgi:DNA-binding transcriptional regulator LsrR (DeoR family)
MVVDYANGMTQEGIARKHGLHIQTVRKRLNAAGVVTRSYSAALTAQDLDETHRLLDADSSAREIARRLGVAHTRILRAIRRADTTTVGENHHAAPRNR